MIRCKFQFHPGQEPELVPEESLEEFAFARFVKAWQEYYHELVHMDGHVTHREIFYAGYRAGYGHAKDDAQQEMHVASGRLPERKA